MKTIDLRSDTVTKPTPAMRDFITNAPVGDDVFGEDPTINELQKRTAELLGKDAALFVPSGTMANQIAIKCHTIPGDEVICEKGCHIFNYEGGAGSMLSGIQYNTLVGDYGRINPDQIKQAIRPKDSHYAQTRLVELENTHNSAGGTIYPIDLIKEIRKTAEFYDLKMHLDGARLWNAHVATGVPLSEYAAQFDSVSVCFSKGLGAPVGSAIAGSYELINRAHRYRKMFGGGMRQAGLLAAGALYALDNNLQKLDKDHQNARTLAEFLNSVDGVTVNLKETATNIVIADFSQFNVPAPAIASSLQNSGVLCIAFSDTRIRFVTHLEIEENDIRAAIDIMTNKFEKRDFS